MKNDNKKGKKNTSKLILIIALLLLLVTVGYATLTTQLNIIGSTTVSKNSWNVYISDVKNISAGGNTVVSEEPTVSGSTDTTKLTYEVELVKPGDTYQFDFVVKNGGTIDIILDKLPVLAGLTTEQDVYINHTITNVDGSAVTVEDSAIDAGETKTYRIKVEYDTNITNDQLPSDDQAITLTATLDYIQNK